MDLPAPLVPAEVDLRDFQYMELDVQLLRDSKFAAEVDAEAFRAGVLLWCAAWHQVPAASLPNNDIELSQLAGFGRVVKEWRRVREQALSLFVQCSDGRLYHRVIAEKACAAWDAKLRHQYDRLCDRIRKENHKRKESERQPVAAPTFEQWKSTGRAADIPPEPPPPSDGNPAETALKGNRTEKERNGEGTETSTYSVPVGTGAAAPPLPVDAIFALGIPLLTAASVSDRNARSMLGHLRKTHGDAAVVNAVQRCAEQRPLEPVAWLQAALKAAPVNGNRLRGAPSDADLAAANAASNADAKRRLGIASSGEIIDA